jgi:hypothetical protein
MNSHKDMYNMGKKGKDIIQAKGFTIEVITNDFVNDFISLTDIAKYKSDEPNDVIKNWMRSKDTIDFLGLWELLNNPNFKPVEFDGFKKEAGYNAFTMSPKKWIENTNAIGLISRAGRNGGTFAHKDIAFEFASWISAEFKLYIIKDYERLKQDETNRLSLAWNVKREISKLNYKIHTEAVKTYLITKELSKYHQSITYASEADVLNVALFGMTAKEWREQNPDLKGNLRDYASIHQLLVLANMESYNAILIKQGISQPERLLLLNKMAIEQLKVIENHQGRLLS